MQGFHYQAPEEVSKVHALMLLSFLLRKGKFMVLRHGMGSLPDRLATLLDVRLNHPISSLSMESDGKVTLTSSAGKFSADRVVLATTATIAKSLFKVPNEIESNVLQTQYSSTINIAIATDENWELPKTLKNIYGILIPRRERQYITSIGIESNKGRERIRVGELFDVMLDSQHGAELLQKSDDEILKTILPELEYYLPRLSQSIRFLHVTRWKEAEPLSSLGRSKNIKKYKENLKLSAPIILAGDYMGFPYTDSAAFTGRWAADFLHSFKQL